VGARLGRFGRWARALQCWETAPPQRPTLPAVPEALLSATVFTRDDAVFAVSSCAAPCGSGYRDRQLPVENWQETLGYGDASE
jgi:hypothetical protein